jgi:hypothetical protein
MSDLHNNSPLLARAVHLYGYEHTYRNAGGGCAGDSSFCR